MYGRSTAAPQLARPYEMNLTPFFLAVDFVGATLRRHLLFLCDSNALFTLTNWLSVVNYVSWKITRIGSAGILPAFLLLTPLESHPCAITRRNRLRITSLRKKGRGEGHPGSGIASIRPRRNKYPQIPTTKNAAATANAQENPCRSTRYPVTIGANIPAI